MISFILFFNNKIINRAFNKKVRTIYFMCFTIYFIVYKVYLYRFYDEIKLEHNQMMNYTTLNVKLIIKHYYLT